jgi:hypothetical protein
VAPQERAGRHRRSGIRTDNGRSAPWRRCPPTTPTVPAGATGLAITRHAPGAVAPALVSYRDTRCTALREGRLGVSHPSSRGPDARASSFPRGRRSARPAVATGRRSGRRLDKSHVAIRNAVAVASRPALRPRSSAPAVAAAPSARHGLSSRRRERVDRAVRPAQTVARTRDHGARSTRRSTSGVSSAVRSPSSPPATWAGTTPRPGRSSAGSHAPEPGLADPAPGAGPPRPRATVAPAPTRRSAPTGPGGRSSRSGRSEIRYRDMRFTSAGRRARAGRSSP